MRIGFYNLLPSSYQVIVKRNGKVCGTLTLVRETDGRLPIDELFSKEIGKKAEYVAKKVEILHAHCADLGRDPSEISLSMQHTCGPDPAENAAQVEEFVDAGANHICLYFDDNSDTTRLGANVDAVVKRIGLEP